MLELLLLTGERRALSLPSHTGTVSAALDRLHDWIETDDGSWVQKSFVVEVRVRDADPETADTTGSAGEFRQLTDAVDRLVGPTGDEPR